MVFYLGMTADAAAAHNSELSIPQSETPLSMPSRHSSPLHFSFGTLTSWGVRTGSVKGKGTETERPRFEQRRSMPVTAAEPISSSDEERYSAAGPSPALPQFPGQQSLKQPSRPKTTYQLAHPPTNARHRRLKLRPRLLLQLQRVSATSRPVPVFDVLPSTMFRPRLTRKAPPILRGKRGLGPNDLVVTSSDLYETTAGDAEKSLSSDEEDGDRREVMATICQPLKDDALSKGKAEICFNCGQAWEATPLPNGSYEFVAKKGMGLMTVRWVRRGPKKQRISAPPGPTTVAEDTRRFTFSVIDPDTRRHPVIASMTRNNLEVYDRYTIPSTAPSSPTTAMSVISDGSEDVPMDQQVIETDENLRMLIIITSIWVAFREGWSPNFRYDDSAKPACSASVTKDITEIAGRYSEAERKVRAEPNRRIVSWNPMPSQHFSTTERSTHSGSLSKRSFSTGAAFIERSNRRRAMSNPHNVVSSQLQSDDETPEPAPNRETRSQPRTAEKEDTKLESPSTQTKRSRRSEKGTPKAVNDRSESPRPTKGKRRRRLSNIFDILVRKCGNRRD
ncbi:hypothetical protein BJX61DRAFT_531700 [Aspergillus egyptiacus]|nr:hypothetical protein BJX61DRAFT_531700 [Aspergillus egyptiacus]